MTNRTDKSTDKYDLNSPFDIEKHNATYVHYFEAIMYPDGTVVYAVPSHQEKLILIAQTMFDWTRKQVGDHCPPDMYLDFMQWLCNVTGCAALWEHSIIGPDALTQDQYNMLDRLKTAGIWIPYSMFVAKYNIEGIDSVGAAVEHAFSEMY